MPRGRRTWGTLRDVIRRRLRETNATFSYWSNTDLLDYANFSLDMRSMELDDAHEGWTADALRTDLVADQREYTAAEGQGRVLRVSLVRNVGGEEVRLQLDREEHHVTDIYSKSNISIGEWGYRPTYRLLGELILLEPAPSEDVTQGLEIEITNAPLFFSVDSSKLDLRFPVQLEELMILDVTEMALAVEAQQGNLPDPNSITRIQRLRREYEAKWMDWIAVRAASTVRGHSMNWGDG